MQTVVAPGTPNSQATDNDTLQSQATANALPHSQDPGTLTGAQTLHRGQVYTFHAKDLKITIVDVGSNPGSNTTGSTGGVQAWSQSNNIWSHSQLRRLKDFARRHKGRLSTILNIGNVVVIIVLTSIALAWVIKAFEIDEKSLKELRWANEQSYWANDLARFETRISLRQLCLDHSVCTLSPLPYES